MSEADDHLMQLILAGDRDGWNQFVTRYQRRLMAFATRQVDQVATAEDLVQETFIGFLHAMNEHRDRSNLESLLFRILRRRIVDHYRRQGRSKEIPACHFRTRDAAESAPDAIEQAPAPDMHASWYARRRESRLAGQQVLAAAVHQLATQLQNGERFRDLKIAEGLFYAGCRNRDLAEALNTTENEIGVVKHRLLKRLKHLVGESGEQAGKDVLNAEVMGGMLTAVWEAQRPSCPKRTTLGKFSLNLLPTDWEEFVQFHVHVLGCTFCSANMAELTAGDIDAEAEAMHQRLFSSTVGFLRPSL